MKPHHFGLLVGLLTLAALILLIGGRPQPDASKATPPAPRTITVTGEGEVRAKPDMVLVTVGIWTHGASAADAEALNRAFVKRVETAMTTAGADPDRYEVTKETVTSSFEAYEGAPPIQGFETRTSLSAVVKNLARSQAVAEAALGAGATSLESMSYGLQSPEESKRTAMRQALGNARERATALVKAEGEKLGELRSMEVLPVADPSGTTSTTGTLLFRAEVRATFTY